MPNAVIYAWAEELIERIIYCNLIIGFFDFPGPKGISNRKHMYSNLMTFLTVFPKCGVKYLQNVRQNYPVDFQEILFYVQYYIHHTDNKEFESGMRRYMTSITLNFHYEAVVNKKLDIYKW